MACGHSCSLACGIFLDQGLNPCPLHWQVDSSTAAPGTSTLPGLRPSSFPSLCLPTKLSVGPRPHFLFRSPDLLVVVGCSGCYCGPGRSLRPWPLLFHLPSEQLWEAEVAGEQVHTPRHGARTSTRHFITPALGQCLDPDSAPLPSSPEAQSICI